MSCDYHINRLTEKIENLKKRRYEIDNDIKELDELLAALVSMKNSLSKDKNEG